MPQKIRRCAIYRRISDEDSQSKGPSLTDQLDATRTQIVKDDGVLKEEHIFADTLSGAGKYWRDRDGIQEMLACAKRHEFDYLYISELDRFGRDVVIQEFMIQELRHYGVTVYSLKIGIRVIVYRNGHRPRLDVQIGPPQIMSKFRPIVSKSSS